MTFTELISVATSPIQVWAMIRIKRYRLKWNDRYNEYAIARIREWQESNQYHDKQSGLLQSEIRELEAML